ncbi:uncharacterized protein LOC121871047 isoform X1 [Homarus americanus]|uniref:uncharacterized protein LOC121871047 isoform X1 n=1 Tax=Homarus americanus TaxID=6706 RepID=UPI001C47B20A|nr:uncharacterized protein LOC121871047 isoform X1 [Homarus americanus]XP_042229068.1 uncharacterized protein LOC121871047 isoform X1 [Homarus americanus]XP_042229069.1 uncharacterized protein LOC121871047 isoform X1 [Homarus americanus]XP_042229070.1 uncharacterized protein LOC121871047 isoform X1 [Homarus americanus]
MKVEVQVWAWVLATVVGVDVAGAAGYSRTIDSWREDGVPATQYRPHEARHRFTTGSSRPQYTRRDTDPARDFRINKINSAKDSKTRGHLPTRRNLYYNDLFSNYGTLRSEASPKRKIHPEASERTRSHSTTAYIDVSIYRPNPAARYYRRLNSQVSPMSSSLPRHQHGRLSYSTGNSATTRSFPSDSPAPDSRSVYSRTSGSLGVNVDSRNGRDDQTTDLSNSLRTNHHVAPDHNSRSYSVNDYSLRQLEEPLTVRDTPQDSIARSNGSGSTPTDPHISPDLHNSGQISPEDYAVQTNTVEMPDRCCGSYVPLDLTNAININGLSRVASAGSVKVIDVPSVNTDVLPPVAVRDLRAAPLDPHTITITWTTPGDDLDFGTASSYVIRMSDSISDLREYRFDLAPEETLLEVSELLASAGVYQVAGTEVNVTVPLVGPLQYNKLYYAALRAIDDSGNVSPVFHSPVSNLARFIMVRPDPETTLDGWTPSHHNFEESIEGTTTVPSTAQPNRERVGPSDDLNSRLPVSGKDSRAMVVPTAVPTESPPSLPQPTEPILMVPEPTEPGLMEDENDENPPTDTESAEVPRRSPSDSNQNHLRDFEEDQPRQGRRKNKNRNKKGQKSKKKNRRKNEKRDNRRNQRRPSRPSRQHDNITLRPANTYLLENSECVFEELGNVSLCDARYSLAIVIAYFSQNNEYQHLDYLSGAMQSLQEKTRPAWQRQQRQTRRGRRREPRDDDDSNVLDIVPLGLLI